MQKPTPFTVRSRIAPRGGRAGGAGPRPFSGNISCIRANRVIIMCLLLLLLLFFVLLLPCRALCVSSSLLPPHGATNAGRPVANAVCTCMCRPSIAATGRQLRSTTLPSPPSHCPPPHADQTERGIHCMLSFQQDRNTWGACCARRRSRGIGGGGCRWRRRRKLWTKGSIVDTTVGTHVYVDYVVLHLPPRKTLSSVRRNG